MMFPMYFPLPPSAAAASGDATAATGARRWLPPALLLLLPPASEYQREGIPDADAAGSTCGRREEGTGCWVRGGTIQLQAAAAAGGGSAAATRQPHRLAPHSPLNYWHMQRLPAAAQAHPGERGRRALPQPSGQAEGTRGAHDLHV